MLNTVCDINNWAVYRKLYVHIIRTIEGVSRMWIALAIKNSQRPIYKIHWLLTTLKFRCSKGTNLTDTGIKFGLHFLLKTTANYWFFSGKLINGLSKDDLISFASALGKFCREFFIRPRFAVRFH